MARSEQFDLVIVGGGTAGATAAYHAARASIRTCVLERSAREDAGARWVNAVPDWTFDAADIARPVGKERLGYDEPFHLQVGYGDASARITHHGLFDADMRLLGARLLGLAERNGAEIRDRSQVLHVDRDVVHTEHGVIRARYVVDASGLSGIRLFGPNTGIELCVAAQEVRHVKDLERAKAFFHARGAAPGEAIAFTAVEGGFSVVNVRLEGDTVSILTGSLAGREHPSGKQMLDRFVAANDFIGERIFGGARAIPIGMPRHGIASDTHASLGDAAVQVFPAHGSGIGIGMIAGRWLAESIAEHDSLEPYEVRFQRRLGGLCAGYEVMRRFTTLSTREELAWLMNEGVLSADLARPGLIERMPDKDPRTLPVFARAARKRPALAARMIDSVSRMYALEMLYRTYPSQRKSRAAWRHAARLVSEGGGKRLLPWVLA